MLKNNFFLLTGGPGSGKSSVLAALANHSFATIEEVGRLIIQTQLKNNGNATHQKDKIAFRKLMLEASIKDYKNTISKTETVFFDRGIPDIAGYSKLINEPITAEIKKAIEELRYNPSVFIFPPWEEIYCQDTERKQNFKEAVETYNALISAYQEFSYTLIVMPKTSIEERVKFIKNKILENNA